MKPSRVFMIAFLLLFASLAGCAEEQPEEEEVAEPGVEDGAEAPVDEEPPVEEEPAAEAEITGVTVTSAPESAEAGGDVVVCWQVEGEGTIPHTAVHFDTESHPDAETFQVYDAGVMYPGNETAQAEEGYELPGEFCTTLPMPEEGNLYFRAHAMIEPPGILSDEHVIAPQEETVTA